MNTIGAVMVAATFAAASPPAHRPLCIAHRGFHNNHRELHNTRAAIIRAADRQIDGVEFDVHFTRDGFAVLNHDASIPGCGDIIRQDLEQLRGCSADVPLLEDILPELATRPIIAVIELKSPYRENAAREHDFFEIIHDSYEGRYDRLWIISFQSEVLASIRPLRSRPGAAATRLIHLSTTWPDLDSEGAYDGIDIRHRARVNRKHIRAARTRGLMVGVWHVAFSDIRRQRLRRLIALDVDFITTDRPADCQSMTMGWE